MNMPETLTAALPFMLKYQGQTVVIKYGGNAMTDETIKHLPKQGCKKLLVISPSFVADCLETLYELELENRTYFEQAGGEVYDVVPCLNADPEFVAFLKDLSK